MDITVQKRIDQAWDGAKGWITEFGGSPTATLLTEVPPDKVVPGFSAIAGGAENFRITAIPQGSLEGTKFISLEEFPAHLEQLLQGKLGELSVNWAVRNPAFELDLHAVIYPLEKGTVSLLIDWWSDQVFSVEEDNRAQFAALMAYFLELQALFEAANLFLSAESSLDPTAEDESWIEV